MGNENQNVNVNANLQPPEDRVKDEVRDEKRKGTAKTKEESNVTKKKKVISILLIIILIFGSLVSFDMAVFENQKQQAKNTPKSIYKTLGVDDLYDLIVIKGDKKSGYYYDFIDGTEEKLDKLVKNMQKDGSKAITKDLLKKMIKAEVVNQFPFLQGVGGKSTRGGGNTIQEKVWNFFIGEGYSEEAVAGMMGNIHHESGGFNPAIVENGGSGEGIGLCQWSYGRRTRLENFAKERGKDWTDLDIQLEYLLWELQNDGFNYNTELQSQWENAETPEEAAIAFEKGFERAGVPMMENRIYWANVYYEQFRGTYGQDNGAVDYANIKSVLYLSSKYETGNSIRALGEYDDNNGVGKYGFDYRGALPGFIIWCYEERNSNGMYDGFEPYTNLDGGRYNGVKVSAYGPFQQTWLQICDEYPEEFEADQDEYIYKLFYEDLVDDVFDYTGVDLTSRNVAVQSAFTSIAVNLGVNGWRAAMAGVSDADTDEEIIRKMYGYMQSRFPSLSRWVNEEQDALAMLNGEIDIDEDGVYGLTGVLFIGDSITNGLGQHGGITEEDVVFRGVDNSTPAQWNNDTNSNFGQPTYSTLPDDNDSITALCVMIGTNNPSQISDTESLLDKLHQKYPEKKIFVQRLLPNNSYASQVDAFNSSMENYCNNIDYLKYIDSTEGVEISSDGIHPTIQGYQTLAENTRKAIGKVNGNGGSSTYLGIFSGTVRIRRVTPNKNIGETKNIGSGDVTDVTSNTPNSATGTQIEEYINSNATSGTWSVYAKNLTSNSVKATVNNQKLESDSLINLFIMATAFEEIEKKALDKNEVIDDIKMMVIQSDKDATNRLIEKLGISKINNYIVTNEYHLTRIDESNNYTSVTDVGNLLEKMYRGTCVNKNASQEMIEIIRKQTSKNKIPAGIPEGVESINKTGEATGIEHDAAIVYKDGAHYILVVMSNDVNNAEAARNNIKEISSKVYNMISNTSSSEGGTNSEAIHKVAIVAGHGNPINAGTNEQINNQTKWYTIGASGQASSGETWNEWQITKKVADYVEQYLYPYSSQVSVVQVGYSQPNWERMQLAKDQGVDSYIGIHFNSSQSASESRSKCIL